MGLLTGTVTSSIAELPPWDFVPACMLREVGLNWGKTSFPDDSTILSHAMVDMNCKVCCSYSVFALQESTGLHGPASIDI